MAAEVWCARAFCRGLALWCERCEGAGAVNPKHELRNSKQYKSSSFQMTKKRKRTTDYADYRDLGIRVYKCMRIYL